MNQQGPAMTQAERSERRAQLDRRVRADLWSAVWEATQVMSYDEIRELVERTLAEVHSDTP